MRVDPLTGLGVPTNPFWDGDPNSNRSRVYQLGVRNPFPFTIHPTGEVWIGDVGDTEWGEINHGPAGADFGWPCFEGGSGGLVPEPRFQSTVDCQKYIASNDAVPPVWAYERLTGAAVIATTTVLLTVTDNGGAIVVDGVELGNADGDGTFGVERRDFTPSSCTVTLTDGVSLVMVPLDGC